MNKLAVIITAAILISGCDAIMENADVKINNVAFEEFDHDKDGLISKDDAVKFFNKRYENIGVSISDVKNNPKYIEQKDVFMKNLFMLDHDKDGNIAKKEIFQGAKKSVADLKKPAETIKSQPLNKVQFKLKEGE